MVTAKPLEVPPAVARAFLKAAQDYFAEEDKHRQDAIAPHQLSILGSTTGSCGCRTYGGCLSRCGIKDRNSASPSLTNLAPYVDFTSMGTEPRLTQQTISVLSALLGKAELSGSEIAKETRLASGSLYPILYRLEEVGWLDSRWEKGDPATLGRPRRRYYRITAEGQKRVAQIVHDLGGKFAWGF